MFPYIYIVLPSYAVLAFLGAFVTLVFLYFRREAYHVPFNKFLILFFSCIVGGFIGSKVLYTLAQFAAQGSSVRFSELPVLFMWSGYAFYGGLFGVLIALHIMVKHLGKLKLRDMHQMIAPALPLFHGFGRIGCMMAGCCYGVTLAHPIIIFNVVQVNLFPTQLVESIYEFLLFGVLYWIGKHYPRFDLLKGYLLSYAVFRFCIEFVRADTDRGMWFGISTSQWISLMIIVYFFIKRVRSHRENSCIKKSLS